MPRPALAIAWRSTYFPASTAGVAVAQRRFSDDILMARDRFPSPCPSSIAEQERQSDATQDRRVPARTVVSMANAGDAVARMKSPEADGVNEAFGANRRAGWRLAMSIASARDTLHHCTVFATAQSSVRAEPAKLLRPGWRTTRSAPTSSSRSASLYLPGGAPAAAMQSVVRIERPTSFARMRLFRRYGGR